MRRASTSTPIASAPAEMKPAVRIVQASRRLGASAVVCGISARIATPSSSIERQAPSTAAPS